MLPIYPRRTTDYYFFIFKMFAYLIIGEGKMKKETDKGQVEGNWASRYNNQVHQFIKTTIGEPEKWLIETAAGAGLDYSKLSHETTNELISHSIKRHGERNIHGAATITIPDFGRIPEIVKNPDYAVIGAIRKETLINAYAKIDEGITYLYFEDVLKSRKNKALRGRTFYKVNRPLLFDEFLNNVSRNKKTDISKAGFFNSQKNVQTAGGHPGG
jgi:hypothetical protein